MPLDVVGQEFEGTINGLSIASLCVLEAPCPCHRQHVANLKSIGHGFIMDSLLKLAIWRLKKAQVFEHIVGFGNLWTSCSQLLRWESASLLIY